MTTTTDSLETLPRIMLKAGTTLYHGTDCAGDFEIPDGPAWFTTDPGEAEEWAGWNVPAHGREDGERRIHTFVVERDVALLDMDTIAADIATDEWADLAEIVTGVNDEILRDEMAAGLKAKGMTGWLGHGEVLLTSPESVLRFIERTSVPGENPMRETPSTYVAPAGPGAGP